jgi:hypothetical protein
LVALAPDVIFAMGSAAVGPLRRMTRTVPIVFVLVPDPVGAGFVDSLARPGGNVTGFTQFEYGIGAKWLEVLKEIAPSVKRAAVIRNADESSGIAQFAGIQGVAPALGVELSPIGVHDAREIERGVTAFARAPNGGLIVTGSAPAAIHRDLIVRLALTGAVRTRTRAKRERSLSFVPSRQVIVRQALRPQNQGEFVFIRRRSPRHRNKWGSGEIPPRPRRACPERAPARAHDVVAVVEIDGVEASRRSALRGRAAGALLPDAILYRSCGLYHLKSIFGVDTSRSLTNENSL